MRKSEISRILMTRGWFSEQPQSFRELLLSKARVRTYGDGEHMYCVGEVGRTLFALLSGYAKLNHVTPEGDELLLRVFVPGDWFGLISLFDGKPLPHNAFAVGRAVVLCLPWQSFEEMISNCPAYTLNFTRLLCQNMRESMDRMVDVGLLSGPQRLARALTAISEMRLRSDVPQPMEIEIAQQELASLASLSRASVSTALKHWETLGWISYRYRRVAILDRDALCQLIDHRRGLRIDSHGNGDQNATG